MYKCKTKGRGRGNEKIEGKVGGERKVTGKERREEEGKGRQGRRDRGKEKETEKGGKRDRNCLALKPKNVAVVEDRKKGLKSQPYPLFSF